MAIRVIKIYDYLNVRLPSSMGSRSTDSMITTQLKTALTASGVPSNSIKVVTTETVIYMMVWLRQRKLNQP